MMVMTSAKRCCSGSSALRPMMMLTVTAAALASSSMVSGGSGTSSPLLMRVVVDAWRRADDFGVGSDHLFDHHYMQAQQIAAQASRCFGVVGDVVPSQPERGKIGQRRTNDLRLVAAELRPDMIEQFLDGLRVVDVQVHRLWSFAHFLVHYRVLNKEQAMSPSSGSSTRYQAKPIVRRSDPTSLRPQPVRLGPDFWPTPASLAAALVGSVLPRPARI